MKGNVTFDPKLIAPCGMNCGTCMAYLRTKNHCPGCRVKSVDKMLSVRQCIIPGCEKLATSGSDFCYDCPSYPCRRIKQLEKRYSTKYGTSFMANLAMIRDEGLDRFLDFESQRRTCPDCGSVIGVHRPGCTNCKKN